MPRAATWIRPPKGAVQGLRVGLLGGSFNPAHRGHLHASELALRQLNLDYVWWVVSPQNPLKPQRGMAEFITRLSQAKAFVHHPRIVVTGIEQQLGTRFTVDTVGALQRRFAGVRFVWLMGSDNMVQIPRWRRWQHIFLSLPVAVVARPGTALAARTCKAATRFKIAAIPADSWFAAARPPAWTVLDWKRDKTSATRLRQASASPI